MSYLKTKLMKCLNGCKGELASEERCILYTVYLLWEVHKTNMLDIHRRRTKEAHEVGQPFLKQTFHNKLSHISFITKLANCISLWWYICPNGHPCFAQFRCPWRHITMEILDLIPSDNDVTVENHYLETWKIRANLPPQNQNAQKKSFIGDLCSVSWKYICKLHAQYSECIHRLHSKLTRSLIS